MDHKVKITIEGIGEPIEVLFSWGGVDPAASPGMLIEPILYEVTRALRERVVSGKQKVQ